MNSGERGAKMKKGARNYMNYFQAITKRASELDAMAMAYMQDKDFKSRDNMLDFIHKRACAIFKAKNEDWNNIPEWVADVMDGYLPYSRVPKNGSLYYSLGFSAQAMDANLRKFWETLKAGKNPEAQEYIPTLAEKEIVAKYTD